MAAKVHILYMHKFLKLFLLFCGKINYEWLRSYLGTHSIDHIISFAIQCANMKCIYMTDIQHKQAKLEVFFLCSSTIFILSVIFITMYMYVYLLTIPEKGDFCGAMVMKSSIPWPLAYFYPDAVHISLE